MDLDAIFSEMESRSTPDDSVLCVIDDNLRIVTVPSSGMVFGVEKDKDVNKIDFEMDRYYRDNDVSEFSARIYYQNAKGNKNYSTVTDLSFTEDKITFSWTVPAYALMYEGTIRFAVNFIKTSGSVVEKAFNTTIASANCLIGLYIDTQIPEKEFEDYLTHLKNEIKGYSDVQLAAIEDAKTKALTGIDDAEEEALLNIKQALPAITDSDFGKSVTVKSDASGVEFSGPYAPIEVAVRPTVSGNPAVAEDSIAWNFQELKIYGKSTQAGTPSPENPVPIVSAGAGGSVQLCFTGINLIRTSGTQTISGITFTDNGDGTITANGTTSAGATYYLASFYDKNGFEPYNNTDYFLSGCPSGGRQSGFRFQWYNYNGDGSLAYDFGEGVKVKCTNVDDSYNIVILITAGTTLSNVTFKPMLNYGDSPAPFEPYKDLRSISLSTPSGLLGIPVDSGGNYTDADGQQLVCDVKDYGTREYTQNCYGVVFDGSEDETWEAQGTILGNRYSLTLPIGCLDSASENVNSLNSVLKLGASGSTYSIPYVYIIAGNKIYVSLSGSETLDEFRDFLSAHPMQLLAVMADPIIAPIPAEELAAYRALTTYDGTTVVSTAEPVAGIEVSYVADTQKYIDKKIEEAISKLNAAQQGEETDVSL